MSGLTLTCQPTDTRCLPTGDALLDLLSLNDLSIATCIGALIAITIVVCILASQVFDRSTRPPWANAVSIVREEELLTKNGYSNDFRGYGTGKPMKFGISRPPPPALSGPASPRGNNSDRTGDRGGESRDPTGRIPKYPTNGVDKNANIQ